MYHRVRSVFVTQCISIAFTLVSTFAMNPLSHAEKLKGTPGAIRIDTAGITYFALEHDTLTSIAKRYTSSPNNWAALGKLNQVQNDRTIPIGSPILIPADLLIEEASQARVVALAGSVTTTTAKGVASGLAIGNVVYEGSQISTDKNSFVTLALPDESRISVPSNSQISLAKLRMTQFIKSPRTLIKLVQGKLESKVTPLNANKGRFEVSSPLAIAGVRGTHFRVGVNDNGIANEVLEGGVAVGNQEKPQALVLPAGQGNVVSKSGVGKAIDLLAAPIFVEGYQLQERPVIQLTVQAVQGAVAYHAQISTDQDSQNIIAESMAKDLRFKFEGIADGRYFIRVTAIDQNHLEGMPSTQAFTLKARPEPPFPLSPKHKVRAEHASFTWTQSSEAKVYRLQLSRDASFSQIVLDQTNISATEWGTDQLTVGQYFWRVASIIDKSGQLDQGPFSPVQSFQMLAPQSLHEVQDKGQNTIDFGWPAEPGQSFLVQISQDPAFKQLYMSKETEQASLSIPRPEAGVYFIRVRATDADRFIGQFSKPQKFEIQLRWTSSGGEPIESIGGAVRPQKQ